MQTTQWTLIIPIETDQAVRTYLARIGAEEDDLSRFVNDAVKKRVFEKTVEEIKERNVAFDQDEILRTADEAVETTRTRRT